MKETIRNKSSYVWFTDEFRNLERIKLGNWVERQTASVREENDEVLYSRVLGIGETDAIAELRT